MDDLLLRQVPQSIEAEQAVLGSMLIDPACVPVVIDALAAEDFYVELNRLVFETIYSMFVGNRPIDPVTVLDEMRMAGTIPETGARDFFFQLMDVTPTSANVGEYIRIVRSKSLLRELMNAGSDIYEMARSEAGDAADIAESAEQKIYSVRQGREIKGLVPIKSAIKEVYDRLDELSKNPGKLPGIPTGLSELDTALGGLNRSDLLLIASRPGMGKTSIALNMALNAAKKSGKKIVIFQLEMSREQLAARILSNEALVDSNKLRTGELSEDDWVKIARATNVVSRTGIYIDDNPTIKVGEMKAKARRLGDDLGLIIIDYLQLMQPEKRGENRVNEVSDISRALKIMAKELNVPVLCLSQLSREPEKRSDKRPMLSDLRESGAIEQDADIVLFLYRDDYYNEDSEERNVAECIISKNRHGPTGTIKLQWLGQFTTFSSRETRYDERSDN